MTRHEALAVAVRLFAIALVLLCVRALPGSVFALTYMQDQDWHVQVVLVGGANAFILLAAAALWKFPFGVASLLLPRSAETSPPLPWSQESAIAAASVVIGLFYLTYAVSDLLYWLVFVIAASGSELGLRLEPDHWAGIITTPIEAALALLLIFGARGIARLIYLSRQATAR